MGKLKVKVSKIEIRKGKIQRSANAARIGQTYEIMVIFMNQAGAFNGGNNSRPVRYMITKENDADIFDMYNQCESEPAPVQPEGVEVRIITRESIVKAVNEGKLGQGALSFGTLLPKEDPDHVMLFSELMPLSDGVEKWTRIDPHTGQPQTRVEVGLGGGTMNVAIIETHHEVVYRCIWDEDALDTIVGPDGNPVTVRGKYVPARGQSPLEVLENDKQSLYRIRRTVNTATTTTTAPATEGTTATTDAATSATTTDDQH